MEVTVLIVEDDVDIQDYYEAVLGDFPLRLLKACNGKEALGYVDTGERIDLIILDVVMPVMDGETFLRALRHERKLDIPVIVSSVDEESTFRLQKIAVVQGVFYKLSAVEDLRTLIAANLDL